jgi:hypothetical protein
MKRRLFLKRSGMAAAGILTAPYLLESCTTTGKIGSSKFLTNPASVPDFEKHAFMFDEAVAELRLFGAGPLVPAEAEAYNFGLDDVAEQILTGAEAPAELNAEFAEFGPEMIFAASELAEATQEFPLIESGSSEYLGLAENYSLLKITRSSAILHSAAKATYPHPERESSARQMYAESGIMYKALSAEFAGGKKNAELNNAELRHGAEHLTGNAELYVGGSNMLSGSQEFLFASAELAGSVSNSDDVGDFAETSFFGSQAASAELSGGQGPGLLAEIPNAIAEFSGSFENAESFRLTKGADFLLAAANSIELSGAQHEIGSETYNQGELLLGNPEELIAESWIKPAESLMDTSEQYLKIAKGEAAELGAERMISGASELLASAETNAENIAEDGETFLWGAEQYIGGTTNFHGSVKYTLGAIQYGHGATLFAKGVGPELAEKLFTIGAEVNHHGAENYELGAEVLTSLQTAEGAVDITTAAESMYLGAEKLYGVAESANAETGALEMVEGAELMIVGAEYALKNGPELAEGSIELLTGSSELNNGVAEFAAAE